ncbi:MAG TPA: hypothetical protein ENL27_02015 [Candidatus Parcubacteria bacterium]|nr:hypothetical protein [Candidatus Parcubacteria bacterium]
MKDFFSKYLTRKVLILLLVIILAGISGFYFYKADKANSARAQEVLSEENCSNTDYPAIEEFLVSNYPGSKPYKKWCSADGFSSSENLAQRTSYVQDKCWCLDDNFQLHELDSNLNIDFSSPPDKFSGGNRGNWGIEVLLENCKDVCGDYFNLEDFSEGEREAYLSDKVYLKVRRERKKMQGSSDSPNTYIEFQWNPGDVTDIIEAQVVPNDVVDEYGSNRKTSWKNVNFNTNSPWWKEETDPPFNFDDYFSLYTADDDKFFIEDNLYPLFKKIIADDYLKCSGFNNYAFQFKYSSEGIYVKRDGNGKPVLAGPIFCGTLCCPSVLGNKYGGKNFLIGCDWIKDGWKVLPWQWDCVSPVPYEYACIYTDCEKCDENGCHPCEDAPSSGIPLVNVPITPVKTPEPPPPPCPYLDIGLRIKEKGKSQPTTIAVTDKLIVKIGDKTYINPLRIAKKGKKYAIALVPPSHPWATQARIKLSSGSVMALMEYPCK